jgi:SidC N-terminal domain
MPISIPLTESNHFRYIRINPDTNRVHLLVPFIAGIDVSTDNTCKADMELKAFFESGAFNELESYKTLLEFHLSLLEEGDALYRAKKDRLEQINRYIEEVVGMRNRYRSIVDNFLRKPSNLYSIQLRPRNQDPMSRVINPVFTINRGNDRRGLPLSPLYNKIHEVFPTVVLGKADPREVLIQKVLDALPPSASFETIQDVLAAQYGVTDDFFKKRADGNPIDKKFIDNLMGFDADATSREYIETLLSHCAPNLQCTLQGSPFYIDSASNSSEKAERLSMLTQFYLGVLNVYCRAKGISDRNFGMILDNSPRLSDQLIESIARALAQGHEVERVILLFFHVHEMHFHFSAPLMQEDINAIQKKFESTYRTVTATKENPHMDDFMLLDTEAQGEQNIFITYNGLICTDAANIIPTTSKNQKYFAEIRLEARTHRDIVKPQDEPVITIDIDSAVLMDKLSDIQLEKLPSNVVDVWRAHPAYKICQFLDFVAKGKQDEAQAILESSEDQQTPLRTPGKFSDYSGRTFQSTAYEYAYWAKDTHMQRMLERHMDDETKALLLEKVYTIEAIGLSYQQHGVAYKNPHYDMSFVLKDLSTTEFEQLQTILAQKVPKLQQATVNNYHTLAFTGDEFEALKKTLESHEQLRFTSFLHNSTVNTISNKLKFDFHSLITALDTYVTHQCEWNFHQKHEGWMKVGQAQRDVPAHIAQEYCRQDRSFDPLTSFTEDTLPRILTLSNSSTDIKYWFPLTSSTLGIDFAVSGLGRKRWARGGMNAWWSRTGLFYAKEDLPAVRQLDMVRINDLKQSRENLSRPANQFGLPHLYSF